MTSALQKVVVRRLGMVDYCNTWSKMREFTAARSASDADELWLVQHPAVFTLGQAGKHEHVLSAGAIPVVSSDRGGQVTYHGPGQVVLYCLLDLRRLHIGVRTLVESLEDSVIDSLAAHGLCAQRRAGAPGVYVADAKIAALGLRVRNACTYHGVSLNVRMDLEPFARINPCGFAGLRVTSMYEHGIDIDVNSQGDRLAVALAARLGVSLRDAAECAQEHVERGRVKAASR